jgi:serpin B
MRRHALRSIPAALIGISLIVPPEVAPRSPAPVAEDTKRVAGAINDLGFALYERLRQSGDGNIVLSPASLSTALALTLAGARGDTAAEIRATLGWTLDDHRLHRAMEALSAGWSRGSGELVCANALWGQRGMGFHREFLSLGHRHYEAGFDEIDFATAPDRARRTINAWVVGQTEHEIPRLLLPGDVGPETVLVLANATRFDGTWKVRFDDHETRAVGFRVSSRREVPVRMMRCRDGVFRYFAGEGIELLELPYDDDRISMIVLVPRDHVDLTGLEARLSTSALSGWLSRARASRFESVEIPRFESSTRLALRDALESLGLRLAFTPKADFSGMTPTSIWLDDVFHGAVVRVDEEGTVAAGSSAVVTTKGPAVRQVARFRADRPFLYLVQDRVTGAILFLGRLIDPDA